MVSTKRIHRVSLLARLTLVAFLLSSCSESIAPQTQSTRSPIEQLGHDIFFDTTLSKPAGQACCSCHVAAAGFSDPTHAIVSEGVVHGLFGNRNTPAIGYVTFGPPLSFYAADSVFVGGFFWDGRVNSLEEQAKLPFLNPLEMANDNKSEVVAKLKKAPYFATFAAVFGTDSLSPVDTLYDRLGRAIAAFERSTELHPFSAKYDLFVEGKASLNSAEAHGLRLFQDSTKGNCAKCHTVERDPASGHALFTNFSYANLGIPKNPNNPFYTMPKNPNGANVLDFGLGNTINDPWQNGKFKTPSLRNIARSAPYGHNGYFRTLEELVHWLNVRDSATQVGAYPAPEIAYSIERKSIGHLGLSAQDESDIVAFLLTLTDGYK